MDSKGFSLIELLIAVAILAVAASIAVPAYQGYLETSRRAGAKAGLNDLALWLERFYTINGRYDQTRGGTTVAAQVVSENPGLLCSPKPKSGGACNAKTEPFYYHFTISATATGYTIKAAPVSGTSQAADPCGTLVLTSTGRKSLEGAAKGAKVSQCW